MKQVTINGVPFRSSSNKLVRDANASASAPPDAAQPRFVRTRNGLLNTESAAYKEYQLKQRLKMENQHTRGVSSGDGGNGENGTPSPSTSTRPAAVAADASAAAPSSEKDPTLQHKKVQLAELEHSRQIQLNKQRRERLQAFMQNLKERREKRASAKASSPAPRPATGQVSRPAPHTRTPPRTKLVQKPCKYFQWTGTCRKGLTCTYIHDPDKAPLCPKYLSGKCRARECHFSHTPDAHRTPHCTHFPRCNRANCVYPHVGLSPHATVCADFVKYGYCAEGINCPQRHTFECPQFAASGKCTTPRCRLLHMIRRDGKPREVQPGAHEVSESRANKGVNTSADDAGHGDSGAPDSDDSDDSDDIGPAFDFGSDVPQQLTAADLANLRAGKVDQAGGNEDAPDDVEMSQESHDELADNEDFITFD